MELRRSLAVASAALMLQAACASTSYMPRSDGRIATVIEDGGIVLVKNGQRLPSGTDGLRQAVAGNPAAEEHANSYATNVHMAFAENLIGLGVLIAGLVVVTPRQDDMGNDLPLSRDRQVAGTLLSVGGLAVLIVAGFQMAFAQAHYQDAINTYNDGVAPRPTALPPGWRPMSPVPLSPTPPGPQVTPAPAPPAATPQAYPPPPQPPGPPQP